MSDYEFSTLTLPETVIIARHGHYPTNAKTFGDWQPGDELPVLPTPEEDARLGLDEKGREQGERLGGFLFEQYPDLEVVLSSTWDRALETADKVSDVYVARRGTGLQRVERSELQERDRGPVYRARPRAWLEMQSDYPVFLDRPASWTPNQYGPPEEQGETLNRKAADIRSLLPLMGELAAGKTLAIAAHGEVVGAALIALAGFGDEQLKKPLSSGGQTWMPRTVYNCGGYIFTGPQDNNRYTLLKRFDASEKQVQVTDWIPINRLNP